MLVYGLFYHLTSGLSCTVGLLCHNVTSAPRSQQLLVSTMCL